MRMRRRIPAVATVSDTKGDDLGVREVMRVMNDFRRSLEKMRVATNGSHKFLFGGYVAVWHIPVKTNPVYFVTDLEGVNGQIGSFHRVELKAQSLGQLGQVHLAELR